MDHLGQILLESWNVLLDAGAYVIIGIIAAGLLKAFLSPKAVARHLGTGGFFSVLKAALFGIPLPL